MKKLLSLLLVLTLVFSLAGCGSDDGDTTDGDATGTDTETSDSGSEGDMTEEAMTDDGVITIWAWDPNFNIAIMEDAKAIYGEDVEINIVEFAKADLEQKLQTILASGVTDELPDIVLIEDYNAQKYLAAFPGSFADLTGKVAHEDFAAYKVSLMTVDGNVYGVPFDSGVSGFFYRSDILAEAGYEASDLENITWDEFITIGEDVFAKTGVQMLATDPNDGGAMRIMLNGSGEWYFDAEGNPTLVDNAAMADAMRLYSEIINSPMTKITSGWGEWVGAINNGEVASITTGCWIIGSVKAEASQSGLWAMAPTPRLDLEGSVNASNLGGSSWYVLSSGDVDASIDFLNATYTNADFYQDILVERGAIGSYLPAAAGEAYAAGDEFFGGQTVFTDFSTWMDAIPALNYGMYTYEADAAIMAQMPAVYNGSSVDDALQMAEDQLSSQIGQ